jgi:hypothetical protein
LNYPVWKKKILEIAEKELKLKDVFKDPEMESTLKESFNSGLSPEDFVEMELK